MNLDLDEVRQRPDLFEINRRQPPKLVHRVIFSMPAGTPADKVLGAVGDFAREEFGTKHRYAMVLHTTASVSPIALSSANVRSVLSYCGYGMIRRC